MGSELQSGVPKRQQKYGTARDAKQRKLEGRSSMERERQDTMMVAMRRKLLDTKGERRRVKRAERRKSKRQRGREALLRAGLGLAYDGAVRETKQRRLSMERERQDTTMVAMKRKLLDTRDGSSGLVKDISKSERAGIG